MQGLVTVVIPCFNYARYLEQCVRSVVQQSHQRWECIIVDDGSTDDTPQVCARLAATDSRITFVRQTNRGLSAARNTGIRRARGDFVQLLDADDILEADKLKVQVEFLKTHPDTDIVLGEAAFFDANAPTHLRPRRRDGGIGTTRKVNGNGPAVLSALVSENICVVHAALLRRTVFDAVGLFDEALHAHEDWDFWLRCAVQGQRFSYVATGADRALVREHGTNMSWRRSLMFRTAISVRERVHLQLPDGLRMENARCVVELKSCLGVELLRAGEWRAGWKLYAEASRSAQRSPKTRLRLILLLPGAREAARLSRKMFSSNARRR